jgi:hypothetical protein
MLPGCPREEHCIDAIVRSVELSESDDAFPRNAEARWAELRRTGKSVAFDEARACLEAMAQGRRPARPSARNLPG